MTKIFTAFDEAGTIILTSRGKQGAAQKVIDALIDYRAAVKAGSGDLYGLSFTLGHIKVDGVRVDGSCGYYAEDLIR